MSPTSAFAAAGAFGRNGGCSGGSALVNDLAGSDYPALDEAVPPALLA